MSKGHQAGFTSMPISNIVINNTLRALFCTNFVGKGCAVILNKVSRSKIKVTAEYNVKNPCPAHILRNYYCL